MPGNGLDGIPRDQFSSQHPRDILAKMSTTTHACWACRQGCHEDAKRKLLFWNLGILKQYCVFLDIHLPLSTIQISNRFSIKQHVETEDTHLMAIFQDNLGKLHNESESFCNFLKLEITKWLWH